MFGRDAGMAEAWLCSQEPLVRSAELGCTVDEVESLIKRHEAFQKSAVAWEERFSALEKLTAVRAAGPPGLPAPPGCPCPHPTPPRLCSLLLAEDRSCLPAAPAAPRREPRVPGRHLGFGSRRFPLAMLSEAISPVASNAYLLLKYCPVCHQTRAETPGPLK